MRKLILFITVLVSLQTFAQEGTKQLMPIKEHELYLEFNVFDTAQFGTYRADTSERIYIYLNAGETMHFGMKMNTYAYAGDVETNPYWVKFRIKDPAGNIIFNENRLDTITRGNILTWEQAVAGPNGVILNGTAITGGYNAKTYTATTTGNHYIEFKEAGDWRFALQFFDVTVTDAGNHVITNPDEPNRSAGRLWSYGWQLCNLSYTQNPVNAHFYVVTNDRLINKVNFEMTTFSFVFLSNKFGITPNSSQPNYIKRTQSMAGDQIGDKNIAEYPVFLNDPDRTVWPNILLSPPKVQVWAEEELFMDYNYNRNPLYMPLYADSVILEKNRPNDCPYDDVTFFKIESNLDGYTVVLIDCDRDGEYSTNNNDRVIYREIKKGLNYILWDFKTDGGAAVANGIYNASATFLGRGPSHFPLYDVEQLSGITTSAIRPFNKLNTTIYWDDTKLLDWGDESGTGAMTETQKKQLRVEKDVPRTWSYSGNPNDDNNGNLNTMNTWFNAIDLGYSSYGVKVRESVTKCVDGSRPYVGDVYMQGSIDANIFFNVQDLDYKFFHRGNLPLSSIKIVTLPKNGILYYGVAPATIGQIVARGNVGNLKYDPNPGFHGKDSLLWEATADGVNWSNNQENIYFVINTDPSISAIDDQRLCTNTPTDPINFTVNDADGDVLTVTGFSANPEFVPHTGIVINGTGTNRTVTVTPVANKSGRAIIYIMVEDGFTQVIEEFAVVVSPSLEFTGDTIVCTGNSLSLVAEETGAIYSWKYKGTEKSTTKILNQASPVSIGAWSLTVTKTVEGNTCSSTRNFNVSVAPITTFTGDTAVCTGETISLVADEVNGSYSWKKNGTQVSTSRTFTKTNASSTDQDSYTLWVSKYGCQNTSPSFAITVKNAASTSNTVTGNTVDPGQNGTLTVSSATSGIIYNVYEESDLTTVIASATGASANLNISIPSSYLSFEQNNIFKVGASNGNCEVMLTDSGKIVVRTPGITVSPIIVNTSEDETTTATFTVKLNTQPTSNVTINLSSSDITEGDISLPITKTLTFTPANYNVLQTVTIIGVNDFIIDGNVNYTINLATVSTDDNYNGKSKTVNATNTDNDVAGVIVNPISGLTTTEAGGTAQFEVVLTCQPDAAVSITLSSSMQYEGLVTAVSRGSVTPVSNTATITFDNSNWNSAVTVTVTGQNDNIEDNDQTYSIITSSTLSLGDSDFNGLLVTDVQILNSDDDNAEVTVTPTSGLITTEAGGSDSFEIVLTSEPTSDVSIALSSSNLNEGTVLPPSVTFNSSNWSTPQTVTVTGVNDNIDDGDRTYNVITAAATSPDGKYNGINPENVAVTNTDNDNASLIVSPITGLLTTEGGGQATFTVRLATQPVTNITISVTSNDNTEGSVSSSLLTFTNANWNTDQTITITGVNDNVVDGNVDYTVTLDVTSGDTPYTNLSDIVISAKNNDNDVAGITVTPTTINTSETGTTATFSLVLTSEPKNDVTINFTDIDNTEGSINKPSVTFTAANWNVLQLVTVTGLDDAIADGPVEYTIVTAATSADLAYNNISVNDVIVTNADNDIAGITVLPTSGQTTEAGGFLDYTIVLNTQPTANVTISISSSDPSEGAVDISSVTFTTVNWATPQTIRITGVNDAVEDGDVPYTIVNSSAVSSDLTYGGMAVQDISMSNTDNDVAGLTVSAISGNTTEAGGTATFTVVLTSEPTDDVVISFVTSDGTEGSVSSASYTFTPVNWNVSRMVTITGQNDDVVDGNQTYSINIGVSSSDGNYGSSLNTSVSVINLDNDVAGITVSAISGSTSEAGGTATFTVKLNTQPVADVLISFSSSNTVEGIPSPLNYTFNSTNWNAPQMVTVTGQDDQVDDGLKTYQINVSVSGSDGNYTSALNTQVNVSNIDNDDAGVTITPTSGLETTEAGGTASFTVVLDTRPLAPVTINLNTSDNSEGTVSSTSITFTTANWNSPQTVTITGVDDLIDDTDITYSIITAIEPGLDDVYNAINPSDVSVKNMDNDIAGITVNPISGLQTTEDGGTAQFTIKLNTQPTAAVRIDLGSSNSTEGIVTPTYYTFTPADWSTAKTVTITGQNDDVDDDNVVYSIITTMVSGADVTYNLINPQDASVTNIDNDVAGFTVNPLAGLYTHENGTTRTFTVRLNSKPYDDVTLSLISDDISEGKIDKSSLTFTPANWSVNQLVTITGQDDDIDDESVAYNIIISPDLTTTDTNYVGLNPPDVSVTNEDDDQADIIVSPQTITINENGSSESFTIVLQSEPTENVTINLSSNNINKGTIDKANVVFTPANWDTEQTVTISPVDNDIDDGNIAFAIITASAVSDDDDYKNLNAADVAVTSIDNDESAINVSAISGNTSESGSTAKFTIVLNSEPTSDVSINIHSDDISEGTVSHPNVTFTSVNWDTPVEITVTGVNDGGADGNQTYHIVIEAATSGDDNYDNIDPADITLVNSDDDSPGVTVFPISGLITTEAGGTATFKVNLNSEPTADVTIGISSNDTGEGNVSSSGITFTIGNWSTQQTITVTGVDDLDNDGNVGYSIILANAGSSDALYDGLPVPSVSATNNDDIGPRANDDAFATNEDSNINIDVLSNDLGLDDGNLNVSVTAYPTHGTAVVQANNTITYIPNGLFNGSDSFTYRVCDGENDCDEATVTINVTWMDDNPMAEADNRGTSLNTNVVVDVLFNDYGMEDGGITMTIDEDPSITEGVAVVTGNNITFTPAAGFIGKSSFVYKISDIDGDEDTALVTINVREINHTPLAVNDNAETFVNTEMEINVLANDIGLEDGFGSLKIQTEPIHGTVIINANRTITYTPDLGFVGADSFEYFVQDVDGDYDLALVNIAVIAVPDRMPVANDDSRATNYEAPVNINVLINDTGLEDGILGVSISSDPINGTCHVEIDNTITYTPKSGYSGAETFNYQVCDLDGDCSTATVTVKVNEDGEINHIPDAVADNTETTENQSIDINVLANDTGLDDGFGQLIVFKDAANGSLTVNTNRTITYTPASWFVGNDEFTYWIEDADGDFDTATVYIAVKVKPNHIPVAKDDSRGTEYETPVTVDVLTNDTGLEDGNIVVMIETVPIQGNATVNPDNTILFVPALGFDGLMTFEYRITDINGDFDIATVTINVKADGVTNHIPIAMADNIETYENTSVDINILANDSGLEDGFGDLIIFENPLFGSVLVNSNRTITYIPSPNYVGDDEFVYWIEDVDGDYDTAVVTVKVSVEPNHIPVAIDDSRGTEFETPVTVNVLYNDIELNDGGIVVSIESNPTQGTVFVNPDNTIDYTPASDFDGIMTFEYRVTDKDSDFDIATVTIVVKEEGVINHIPVAVNDSVTTFENTAVDILVLSNDTILDGFGNLKLFENSLHGTVTLNANRTFTYTPSPWYIGTDEFKYWVEDVDGDYDHDIASVHITITEVPDAIPVAKDDSRATEYETAVSVDVLINDSGLENTPISLSVSVPTSGSAIVNGNNIDYTPTAGYSGIASFTYTITDADGDSDNATVTITVLPEGVSNHIPIALDDIAETVENTAVTVNVLANDTLLDGFGDLKIYSNPTFGSVTVNANRTITYTPSNFFLGIDNFEYWVEDIHGDYAIATVSVEVTEVPDALPLANDDARATEYETAVSVDVLINDSGLENTPISLSVSVPTSGSAIVNGNNIDYTPAAGYSGTASFTYTITDADGDSDNATVTITVLPEGVSNHQSIAVNDTVFTIINTAVTVNVLANDTLLDGFGDLKIYSNPLFGSIIVNTNRTITYTPSNFFIGNDSFDYWLEDIHGDYAIATVSVEVTEVPDALPVANDDSRATEYETTLSIDVLINDNGLENTPISLSVSAPTSGTAIVNGNNIDYTPATGYSGTASFTYTITDADGDSDNATVTITVLPEGVSNHQSIAVNDTVLTSINTAITVNVLANDTLPDGFGDLMIYSNPSFGSVTVNANRTITYTPSNLFKGNDRFDYWIEDIHGDYDIATVFVTITEVPDALPVANDDARGTEYQTMVSVDVLTNDKGLDDQPVNLTIESDPAQGTAVVNVNRIEFTPATGFAGLMTFEYRVTDKDGDFDVAKVTITVKNEGEINHIPVAVNDSVETMENTPVDINVLANDSGLEDGFKQIIIFNQPEFGAVVVNPNRTVTYQPSPWFIGTEEFVYWVEDLEGDYDTAHVVVHVDKPGNHLPEAFDDARGTNFDTPVSVDVLTNDKGLEDGGIVVSIETNPAQGSAAIINNEVVFTPETGFVGKETLLYRVTDKEGDFDIAKITITVKPFGVENLIPVAVNDTVETIENTPITISILANDLNLDDGFGKIILFTAPLFGDVQINNNRTITYTPANAFIGADSLVYWVEDIDGDYDMASVFIEVVVKPDYQPIANDDARGCEYESTRTVDVLTNDIGLEDAPVLVTVTVAPNASEGTTMVNADNTITFTAATGFSGTTTFRYTVTDNDGDSDDAQVTITVLGEGETNHIPVAVNDTVSTIVNTSINISVLANDTIEDNFGRLIIHHVPQFGIAVVTGRTIVYTPSNMFVGTDKFDYWVEDVHGDYSIASVVIEVTDRPDYQPVASDDARGCEYQSTRTVDVLTNDAGLEDAPVLVTITVAPNAAEGTTMVNADNTITFTAATGFSGTTMFRYSVTDNNGDSDDAQVTITVLGEGETNHIPVAVNDTVSTIVNTSINISVLANDTIEDNFGRLIVHHAPQFGTAVVTGRTIVYTPSNMFVGTDKFDYWVEDVHGDYAIATVVIDVTDRPDYQPIANDDARGCEYESTRAVDVLTNDTGLDDAPILVTVTVAPNAAEGTTMVNADNTITFTAATGFAGITTFRYAVTDNDGDTDDAQVTITVLPEGVSNHIPLAVDDEAFTIESNAVDINVLANDNGLNDGIQSVIIFRTPSFGNVTVNADYTVTYVPSPYFVGIDEFEYLVSDVHGDNDIAKVTVDVRAIANNIPVANDDSRGTSLNTDVVVDVLANDTGLEDGGITVSIVSNPSNGTIVVNLDNTVTYTPNTGFMGTDQFEYQVCDINNDCDAALVSINVKEINYNPLAVDDKYYIETNSTKTIDVLDNDSGLEDGGIEVEILTQVMVGQAIVNDDNSITYTSLTGFEGVDYFAYKVTDIDGDYDIAMVSVHVTSGPLPGATITYAGNTSEDGREVQLSIVLNTEPTADVSIELSSQDLTEGTLSSGRVTFTSSNWSTPQVISVTGVDDHLIDGNIEYRIGTQNMVSTDQVYDGLNVESVTLINEDNDVANIILAITNYTTSEDADNTQFTLELATEPVSEVSINIINSDVTEGLVEPENIVFTPENWNVKQTITVSGLDDDLKDGDIQYELSFVVISTDNHYDMFSLESLQLTNIDNDGKFGLVIPEAFSPDNDGYNDKFEILGLEKYSKLSIKIYNRWGNLVYSENSYQNNWDGKANSTMAVGKELPTGTYFYIITIRDINKEMSGYIFLKR